MDSSVSPIHSDQEVSAWNGYFNCSCYHPNFLFNQFGMQERCALRNGNVQVLKAGLTSSTPSSPGMLAATTGAASSGPMPPVLSLHSTSSWKPPAFSTPSECPPTLSYGKRSHIG